MPVSPLARQALYEEVAELLRQRIFTRALQPGAWIDETALSLELGISRTPMREALKVLAAEGLVTMKVRRGAYVAEVSQADLQDVYHLLGLLEGDAGAALAGSATDAQLEQLAAMHAELEASADDAQRFFSVNERFHLTILEMAHNRWRLQVVADLRKVMKLHRHQSLFKAGRIADSLQEHRNLLQALQARDPQAARQLLQQHYCNGLNAAMP